MANDPAAQLEQSRRTTSRIALYSTLVVVALTAWALMTWIAKPLIDNSQGDWQGVEFESMPEVELFRDYLRIDTSASTGSSLDGANFLADHLRAAGIEPTLEVLSEREANLWAIIEGEQREAIVLHHHIDVEDIHKPETWNYPPFGAEINGPWVYGRGAFDMKSVGIAQLLAFERLATSGRKPKTSVIFLATTGEETGSHLGTRWILDQHPELTERFDLVLTEGGVVEGRTDEDLKYWGTEFGQKRYVTMIACDPSKERLENLRADLEEYGRPLDDLIVRPEIVEFLHLYAQSRDRDQLREDLLRIERIVEDPAQFAVLPGYIQAMFRNEIWPGAATQSPDGGWQMPFKVHLLPGQTLDDLADNILHPWMLWGVETVVVPEPASDLGSPVDHPILDVIREEVTESYPDVLVGPMFLAWTATDSRFFRAKGIPSYGFSPFAVYITDALHISRGNERIALPAFVEGVGIYDRLLERATR